MGYDRKYYKRHLDQYHEWEQALARYYFENYEPYSVLDLGCGVGSYLLGFVHAGVEDIKGYELNYETAKEFVDPEIRHSIVQGDATDKSLLDIYADEEGFDCVWCIEVAEHIDPDGTDTFLYNLVRYAEDKIVLSAAPPGQAGTGHINCRPQEFWILELEKKGFKLLAKESRVMADAWKELGAPEYIVDNVMLFERIPNE